MKGVNGRPVQRIPCLPVERTLGFLEDLLHALILSEEPLQVQ